MWTSSSANTAAKRPPRIRRFTCKPLRPNERVGHFEAASICCAKSCLFGVLISAMRNSPLPCSWPPTARRMTGATNSNPKFWPMRTHGKQAAPSSGAGILFARQIDRHPQSSPYRAVIVQALQQHGPAGTNSELGTTTRKATVPAITARWRQASPHSPPTPSSLRGGVADAAIQFHRPTDAIVDSKTADRENAGVKRQLRSAASLSSPANPW